MVQPKNYLHTVMQSFSICCLISCVWMIFGYSLAFREGRAVIGGPSRFWLLGMETWSVHPLAPTIPESVYMVRRGARAACTCAHSSTPADGHRTPPRPTGAPPTRRSR